MSAEEDDEQILTENHVDTCSSHLYVETMSKCSLLLTFICVLIVEGVYTLVFSSLPKLITEKTVYYPLVQKYSNNHSTVNVWLETITKDHKFLKMDVQILRHGVSKPLSNGIKINSSIAFLNSRNETVRISNTVTDRKFLFEKDSDVSNRIPIMNTDTNWFSYLNGFQFTYTFVDPDNAQFSNALRLGLFGLSVYALVGFVLCGRINSTPIQLHVCFLGFAAALACNPLETFFPSCSWLSPIFMGVFLTIFRDFCFRFIEFASDSCRNLKFMYIPFLVIYCFIETSGSKSPLLLKVQICAHVVYCMTIVAMLWISFSRTTSLSSMKLAAISPFILQTVGVTLGVKVVDCILNLQSTAPFLLYESSHIISAISFLFLLHTVYIKDDNSTRELHLFQQAE